MDCRPQIRRETPDDHPVYHIPPTDPLADPQGHLGAFILRELLALPPGVLDRPVFAKVKGHLENYRKHYVKR